MGQNGFVLSLTGYLTRLLEGIRLYSERGTLSFHFRHSGTKLEKTSLSTDVFRGPLFRT